MKLLFKLLCVPLVFTTLVMPLSDEQLEQVETILTIRLKRFNMQPILDKYQERFKKIDDQTAELHAQELIRFLILCAISNAHVPLMSTHVSNLWDIFSQFKKQYADFCNNIISKKITVQQCVKQGQVNFKKAQPFSQAYEEAFGKSPSREVWDRLPQGK